MFLGCTMGSPLEERPVQFHQPRVMREAVEGLELLDLPVAGRPGAQAADVLIRYRVDRRGVDQAAQAVLPGYPPAKAVRDGQDVGPQVMDV